jgi:glutamate dehydrogenase/leucine dehydrogenase
MSDQDQGFSPLLVQVADDDGSPLGYLSIDSVEGGKCCGGIRMTSDVTPEETSALARTMSLKFAFMRSFIGGAKAGIICPLGAHADERRRRLEVFGRRLAPLLRSIYVPGGDIGVGTADVDVIRRAAGLPVSRAPNRDLGGFFTALGVFVTAMAWLKHRGLKPEASSVVIEGYGKVGRPLARLFSDAGFRVVGVSTVAGAVINAAGLDIAALEESAAKVGDECVLTTADGQGVDASDLFRQAATIVVPGARPWSIHAENVSALNCDVIVPAANIPITSRAEHLANERGIDVLPEFVVNSAGIFAWPMLQTGFSFDEVCATTREVYMRRFDLLTTICDARDLSYRAAALEVAGQNLERMRAEHAARRNRLRWIVSRLRQPDGLSYASSRASLRLYTAANRHSGWVPQTLRSMLRPGATAAILDRAGVG